MQVDTDRMVDRTPQLVTLGKIGGVTVRPDMSQDILHLALQIRAMHEKAGHTLVLLFMPVSPETSAARIVHAIGRALACMQETPVMVIGLKASGASEMCVWSDRGKTGWTPENVEGEALLLSHTGELAGTGVPSLANHTDLVGLLCSNNFAALLAGLRNCFQYILLSGEPVSQSIESLLVSPQCDGVVLTVVAGKTRLQDVQQARSQLERGNAQVLGFIFDQSAKL